MSFEPTISQRIMLKAKRRVVKDWRQRLRDFSTVALALGTALQGAWLVFPEDLKASLPSRWVSYALGAILVWGLVGKFVVQGPPAPEPPAEPKP